jgi:hypothetical protein
MDRPGHNNISVFIGTEVEHSPAYGMKTLFVVGYQPIEEIERVLADPYTKLGDQSIQHIYFGANQSFPRMTEFDSRWTQWENMIHPFLTQGYWCTLDLDISCVEGLLESGLTERNQFIPMISVKLPHIQQLGYNATIKLDDKDFAASNPGVWCHSLHSLTKREGVFTDWSKYTNDEVVR